MSQQQKESAIQPQLRFDWTINVSTLIQLLGIAVLAIGGYISLSNRIVNLEVKVGMLYTLWERNLK